MKMTKSELLRRVEPHSFIDTWNRHRHPKNRNLLRLKQKNELHLFNDYIDNYNNILAPEVNGISIIEFFQVFYELSNTLNPQLFWFLFGDMYTGIDFNHQVEDEVRKMITKQRMSIPIMDRIKLSNLAWAMKVRGVPSKHSLDKEIGWFIKKIKRAGVNNYMTVYRGFIIKKDEGIPIKNPDVEGGQIFGKGMSYTLSRDVAVKFATRLNIFDYLSRGIMKDECKEYVTETLGISQKKYPHYRKKWLNNKKYRESQLNSPSFNKLKERANIEFYTENPHFKRIEGFNFKDDVRSVVATYTVHKKDIICLFNRQNEQEIFVLPENVKLKRYDFLTIEDFKNPNRFTFQSEEELLGLKK